MGKRSKSVKKTDLKANKPWLKKVGISISEEPTIESNKTFLIVCEGQTEQEYFNSFKRPAITIQAVGLGCSNSTLIECTIEMKKDEEYDEVWSVYDLDYTPDKGPDQNSEFDNSINKGRANSINIAYSNDVFELWFLLHYENWTQKELRHHIYDRLSAIWDMNYVKNGKLLKFCKKIPQILECDENSSQKKAIERAIKLFEAQKELPYHQQNPVTKVYELVVSLII